MSDQTKEELLLDAFASLADTLVAGYEIVDLLQLLVDTCATALEVTAAGLLLADRDGRLELVASTSEQASLIEVLQLDAEAGPCIESYQTGLPVSVPDTSRGPAVWAEFDARAAELGFASVYSVPLRLREERIGALNLFGSSVGGLSARDIRAAQALGDVATIGILHERTFRAGDVLREQLQLALDSRVLIEQAKGVVAQTRGISPDEAFRLIRTHARSTQQPLASVAQQLVRRILTL
jgi:ANTAR domain/GAF domain